MTSRPSRRRTIGRDRSSVATGPASEVMSRSESPSVEQMTVPLPPRDIPDEDETEPETTQHSASEYQKSKEGKYIFLLKWRRPWRSDYKLQYTKRLSEYKNDPRKNRLYEEKVASLYPPVTGKELCTWLHSMKTRLWKFTENN